MAKKLSSFEIECHLDGWHCKTRTKTTKMVGGNVKICRKAQKFSGDEILERMVQALEPPVDTFRDKATGKRFETLTLNKGGSVEDLREAFESRQKELRKGADAEVVRPEPTPDPEPEPEEKKKEPKRTPRPPQ